MRAQGFGSQGLYVALVLLELRNRHLYLALLHRCELVELVLQLAQQFAQRRALLPGVLVIVDYLTGLDLDQGMLNPLLGVDDGRLAGVVSEEDSYGYKPTSTF